MQKKKLRIYNPKLKEECGVFGISNTKDASTLTALGLHALQHRGQEGCGIVSFDGMKYHSEKRFGLVGDNFNNEEVLSKLPGNYAIGHNRYSTTGGTTLRNVQPFYADTNAGGIAVSHNGNLTNAITLRNKMVENGSIFYTTSDTETIVKLIAKSKRATTIDKIIDTLFQIQGGYALVMIAQNTLIGVRDPHGIRPLVIGKLKNSYVFTSETCALDIIGAKFIREIEPGEVIVITEDGEESIKPFPNARARPCIFEYIYFSRPDSMLDGKSVYECRKSFGKNLARECPSDADIVVPVPDSGVPAALGYSEESKIPFELSIIRNHYVGRTFILPSQSNRQSSVKLKHNPDRSSIKGKSVVLVDDSIVRGTTSVKIVELIREAGASEIHMRIACPPIKYPDFYGIDTPETEQLLASNKSLEEMCKYIGADTLGFLSLDGLYQSMGCSEGRNNDNPEYTDHCFTGDYPTNLNDYKSEKIQEQLSLLSENESQN